MDKANLVLDEMRAAHVAVQDDPMPACRECGYLHPCDAARLIAAVDDLLACLRRACKFRAVGKLGCLRNDCDVCGSGELALDKLVSAVSAPLAPAVEAAISECGKAMPIPAYWVAAQRAMRALARKVQEIERAKKCPHCGKPA